jgi:hypothetical protein
MRSGLYVFDLDPKGPVPFEIETFGHAILVNFHIGPLQVGVTYYLSLQLSNNCDSKTHNSFLTLRLNRYNPKDKSIINLYNNIYKIIYKPNKCVKNNLQ